VYAVLADNTIYRVSILHWENLGKVREFEEGQGNARGVRKKSGKDVSWGKSTNGCLSKMTFGNSGL